MTESFISMEMMILNDFYHEREDRSESLLYQVDLSTGEAYQVEFSFDEYVTDLYILDHQMYLRTYDENYNTGYHTIALEENGEIGEEITDTREDGRASIPAGYEEIQISGYRRLALLCLSEPVLLTDSFTG